MHQLNLRARTLEWHEVPAPTITSAQAALVRPLVVSTCDMDGIVIAGLAPFRGPLPVGHEGVAEVIEIGEQVTQVAPDDRVIVPWKISCGTCDACRAGHTAHCHSVPREAAYSWVRPPASTERFSQISCWCPGPTTCSVPFPTAWTRRLRRWSLTI